MARRVIRRYHPLVVGVTGSVGKTMTKDVIAQALGSTCTVRASVKSFNNNIGLPLTILGHDSGYGSLGRWLAILVKSFWLAVGPRQTYPEILVLEYGVDRPGDMNELLRVVKPTIAVITAITPAHQEFFAEFSDYVAEKMALAESVTDNGLIVVNGDDPTIAAALLRLSAPVRRVGFAEGNDCRLTVEQTSTGLVTKFHLTRQTMTVMVPNLVADVQALTVGFAWAVAEHLSVSADQFVAAMTAVRPPPGRLNRLDGIHQTTLLDDTYNASPAAVEQALKTLAIFPTKGKRWAALGVMAELGAISDQAHRHVGEVAVTSADHLVVVGDRRAQLIREGAISAGLTPEHISMFPDTTAAARFLVNQIAVGDTVLIKGSQAARMEQVTKLLLADPSQAEAQLVRQGSEWRHHG